MTTPTSYTIDRVQILQAQLAATELCLEKMREALAEVNKKVWYGGELAFGSNGSNELARDINKSIQEALQLQPSLSALNAERAKVLEEVQMMFIKWYVSEREARFVFASTEKRDEFVKLMIGASNLRGE